MSKKASEAHRAQIEREVITCLYRLLNASDPQVPVDKHLAARCEEVLGDLLEERTLSEGFGYWGLIIESIDWEKPTRTTGPRYGLPLLRFVGHLGEALQQGGDIVISRIVAIQLLMEFQDESDAHFRYGHSDEEHWWIETTPEGERAIGYPVKLDVAEPPFDRMYGVPQEAFDRMLGIGNIQF
jgi:hypothetical protein